MGDVGLQDEAAPPQSELQALGSKALRKRARGKLQDASKQRLRKTLRWWQSYSCDFAQRRDFGNVSWWCRKSHAVPQTWSRSPLSGEGQ